MTVVFYFGSKDHRQRTVMSVDSVEAAARHVIAVLNRGSHRRDRAWTLDEDGIEVPGAHQLRRMLSAGERVTLYDQDTWSPKDTVSIFAL